MQIQKIRKERFRTLRLLLSAITLGSLVGYAVMQAKTVDDRTTKIAEAKTLLHLTNSFVSVYSQHTQSTQHEQFPVPASFRANAAQQFNEMQSGESQPIVSMVGLAGREISTPPVDQALADRLETMVSNRNFSQYSTEFDNDKDKFLRTVFPTIANQDSCVDCHNQLQPNGPTWVKGDLMGAYVVDRPIGTVRQSIFQYSLLVGVLVGFVTLLAGALHAYSRRLKLQAIKLRLLADTDPLTGCLNRRAFGNAFEQNSIHKVGGAILVLDLDFFKNINDTYGHSIGDQVLVHFVDLVKTQIRDEEFLLVSVVKSLRFY